MFGVREGVAVAIVVWNKKRNPPLAFGVREEQVVAVVT
jgi:hypothetical protein